jgi:hypothetical protein
MNISSANILSSTNMLNIIVKQMFTIEEKFTLVLVNFME